MPEVGETARGIDTNRRVIKLEIKERRNFIVGIIALIASLMSLAMSFCVWWNW